MTQPIRGKVARVLNAREIAINIGTTHGAQIGMYFDVRDPNDQDIPDPDTGEVLGSIDRPKVRVKITRVEDKLSVASTYKSTRVNVGGLGSHSTAILEATLGFDRLSKVFMPPKWVTKYETLQKTEKTPEPFDEKDSKVKTGDLVVQVLEVDEPEPVYAGHFDEHRPLSPGTQVLKVDEPEKENTNEE